MARRVRIRGGEPNDLPVRHRPKGLLGQASSRPEPIAAECDELFERMNRLLKNASPAWAEPLARHLAPPRALRPAAVQANDG